MQLLSMLGAVVDDVMILPTGYQIGLNWLGHFARIIIEGVGIVALGIIVFNLVLKAITLPFDIYQRVMMRKQNLVMQKMQPELEKLQKQYANDKQMYSQKMFELQKKSGYSMLGACLPMIVSLVILIVAWQGFRAYSQYANLNIFEHMSESYNSAVLVNGVNGIDFRYLNEEGSEYFVYTDENGEEQRLSVTWENGKELDFEGDISYVMTDVPIGEETAKYLTVTSKNAQNYIFYYYNMTTNAVDREYKVDCTRFAAQIGNVTAADTDSEASKNALQAAKDAASAYVAGDAASENALKDAAKAYFKTVGSEAAAARFRGDAPKFLWIKNVWYPDVSYNHPIPAYDNFESEFRSVNVEMNGEKKSITSLLNRDKYNDLTAALSAEKEQANGYFILIVLSIGFMLLSQIVAMKSNKTANKYQTVDGQGATTQKMMLVVMPIIYAIFSFTYSAAFSIYMTMSSIVGIIVTLLTNLILGKIFKHKEEKEFVEEHTRKLPWMK